MPGRLSDLAAVTATEASSLSTAATAGASSPATSSSYGDFFSVGKRRASGCGERALVGVLLEHVFSYGREIKF